MLKRIDHFLLKRYPRIWVWGLHIFVPISLVLMLLMYLAGLALPVGHWPTTAEVRDMAGQVTLFMSMVSIILLILYFVRQGRFNAKRVHHKLPFSNALVHFGVFFGVISLFAFMPMTYEWGVYTKLRLTMDEAQFEKDVEILNRGFIHFYDDDDYVSDRIYVTDLAAQEYIRLESDHYRIVRDVESEFLDMDTSRHHGYSIYRPTYYLDKANDRIILHRHKAEYGFPPDYSTIGYWDTLSIAEAEQEMRDFMAVSPKYSGNVRDADIRDIIGQHAERSMREFKTGYRNDDYYNNSNFDFMVDEDEFDDVLSIYSSVIKYSHPFENLRIEFFKWYIILPFSLAYLLLILASTGIGQFAWGVLVHSLTYLLTALLTVLLNEQSNYRDDDEWSIIISMVFMAILYLVLGRGMNVGVKFKRALTVSFQIFVPIIIAILYGLGDSLHRCDREYYRILYPNATDPCSHYSEYFTDEVYTNMVYFTVLGSMLLSVYLFNRYYKKQFVHPNTGLD